MKKLFIILALSLLTATVSRAQKFSVSSNAVEWANFGTVNADFGMSIARHLSLSVGGAFNGWDFSNSDSFRYNKHTTGYVGLRYWPWYVFSGLWIQGKAQYIDFKNTGIWRPALDTGKGVGAGLAAGYTLMVHEKLNIEFGLGGWGGKLFDHTLYCCPRDMIVRETGPKTFADFDEVSISIMYVF